MFAKRAKDKHKEPSRTKEGNEQQREIPDSFYKKPKAVLRYGDISGEDLCPEQQEQNSKVEQEEPEPNQMKNEDEFELPFIKVEVKETEVPQIKEEEKPVALHIKEEEEEEDINNFPLTIIMKNEHEEEGGGDGDPCGKSQADSLFPPLSDSADITSHFPDTDYEHPEAGDQFRVYPASCPKIARLGSSTDVTLVRINSSENGWMDAAVASLQERRVVYESCYECMSSLYSPS
ncbi:uncharacterized protein LOC133498262 isoform X3 [Syngnathoides biaculeatus]|uniref:uncharacterized protein LOC133498262 isoform X3 n=1 Tax=Syngnathoides biaculeatus TaxID=300417 RepID=UPI002ADD7B3C|nr:uncharacterized protein LOC133498262 isoform X3 [Syngnathoides biaculeatus]